ncbi:hypothetical protein ACFY0F_19075 [Streptomyces sp. NPDC001544]|uniref:hypothetical protein n=1 Tax=Streptomyces sp. NPDC001544 TaxID=3364584 RepID=UPI00368AA311
MSPVHIAELRAWVRHWLDVAHGGYGNRANGPDIPHQQLTEALRTDAHAATPDEAVRAREYADDLASAVDAQDTDRTARILARINALLSTATAAFTLTRGSPAPRLVGEGRGGRPRNPCHDLVATLVSF